MCRRNLPSECRVFAIGLLEKHDLSKHQAKIMLKQHDCSSAARNTASRRSFTCLRICTRALGKISFGAGKPDSVPPRQVGASVVISLRPTLRRTCPPPLARERACKDGCGIPAAIGRAVQPPILPCTGRGFSCRRRHRRRGGLLPHLFTITHLESQIRDLRFKRAVCFL